MQSFVSALSALVLCAGLASAANVSVEAGTAHKISSAPHGTYGQQASIGFDYSKNKLLGVNLGGWLVLEPWITPSLFEAFDDSVVDEYTMGAKLKGKASSALKQHYESWITEKDFKAIASHGFNHVRIPIGYAAIIPDDAPFVVAGQFEHLKNGVLLAKKYNLSVIVDLHGAPGSQNGFDNSQERTDKYNWQSQIDNPRIRHTLKVIDKLATEFRKSKYGKTVVSVEPINEPFPDFTDPVFDLVNARATLNYYEKAYPLIHKPGSHYYISQHSGFRNLSYYWRDWMPRESAFKDVVLTDHPYQVFDVGLLNVTNAQRLRNVCATNATYLETSKHHDVVIGEFSTAVTDCAYWLNGRGRGSRYEGTFPYTNAKIGSCKGKTGDASKFTSAYKTELGQLWEAQIRTWLSTTKGFIAWTWKTEAGTGEDWSVSKAIEHGWIQTPVGKKWKYSNPC